MAVQANTDAMIKRIKARLNRYQPESREFRAALLNIARRIEADAKLNIRKPSRTGGGVMKPLIDTGRLFNSIRHEFTRDRLGVFVGSFGVPYARLHEFGYRGDITVRAHQRTQTQAFGRAIQPKRVNVRNFKKRVNYPERPYLRPAYEKNIPFIVDTLRALFREKP